MARRGRTPIYGRVTAHVQQLIVRKGLRPGDALPSERTLAKQLGVSYVTVRRGLDVLVEAGTVQRFVGRGTFVAQPPSAAEPSFTDAPNAVARAAEGASGGRRTVILAVDRVLAHLPSVGYALAGMRQVFPQDDVCVELVEFKPRHFQDLYDRILRHRPVAGLVVQGWLEDAEIAMLNEQRLPFVMGHTASAIGRGCPSVALDYGELIRQAVHEAYRFGHRQLAYIRWTSLQPMPPVPDYFGLACRMHGLHDTASRTALLLREATVGYGDDISTQPTDPAAIDLTPHRQTLDEATCIITSDEVIASALMSDLAARGRSVPDDVSIISLHDFTPHVHRVPLAAPNSPVELAHIFREAAIMLEAFMAGHPPTDVDRRHRCSIVFKASLANAPAERAAAGPTVAR
ncbi:MAG: GntR family transcriptional regulator [bacterium]